MSKLFSASLAIALAAIPAAVAADKPAVGPRILDCELGHVVGLDASRAQTLADVRHEGVHPFSLYLAASPARSGPPPSPTDDPEPVDPATRVIVDPAGLSADMAAPFRRVVDLWPERVELIADVQGTDWVRFIAVSEIDPARGTANLFTTIARDAGSLDLARVYQGGCRVRAGLAR